MILGLQIVYVVSVFYYVSVFVNVCILF